MPQRRLAGQWLHSPARVCGDLDMPGLPLSVLDQSPVIGDASPARAIAETIALARLADRLGYARYWLAEHHGLLGLADASPEILLARIGAETRSIRIGTGGIMLPYYSTFKIAEQFKMLEALYPGRVDLGVGRAPGGHPSTARLLFDGKPMGGEGDFINQLAELSAIFKGTVPEGHPLREERVNPAVETAPELWVLGSSDGGASFAAHLGMRFAFAHFINAYTGAGVARAYRQQFRPGHEARPHLALAVLAIVADDRAEAQRIEKAMLMRWALTALGRNRTVPTLAEADAYEMSEKERRIAERDRPRAIIGTAQEVTSRIEALADQFQADEVILVSMAPGYELRTRTLEQMAGAWGLREAPSA